VAEATTAYLPLAVVTAAQFLRPDVPYFQVAIVAGSAEDLLAGMSCKAPQLALRMTLHDICDRRLLLLDLENLTLLCAHKYLILNSTHRLDHVHLVSQIEHLQHLLHVLVPQLDRSRVLRTLVRLLLRPGHNAAVEETRVHREDRPAVRAYHRSQQHVVLPNKHVACHAARVRDVLLTKRHGQHRWPLFQLLASLIPVSEHALALQQLTTGHVPERNVLEAHGHEHSVRVGSEHGLEDPVGLAVA